ncbi:MAG: DNA polymerase III subunit delta' [Pseudomonadales bacterium]|nr:DNA polymerase III subunit delta' [Pseudomonadales bacterium]
MNGVDAGRNVTAPLPWQATAWERVLQQLEGGKLPHALLLSGPEYGGKSRFALALARLLLCKAPVDGLNCGHCHACDLSGSGNNGDLLWLAPEGKSRVIKIDAVRALVDFTNRTAGFGLRKVAVLCPAENMNASAANALLKSLEEPSAETYLILVSHRPHGLPATVRSRCQMLRLGVPETAHALAWLQQFIPDRGRCEELLTLAGGRPLLAETLQREEGATRLLQLRQALQALLAGHPAGAEAVSKAVGGEPLEFALAQLAETLQASIRGLEAQALTAPAGRAAFRLLDEINRIRGAVAGGSNPNPQVLLEALLARMQRELGDRGVGAKILRDKQGVAP